MTGIIAPIFFTEKQFGSYTKRELLFLFTGAKELDQLFVRWNKLVRIGDEFFTGLSKLKSFDVSGNQIVSITQEELEGYRLINFIFILTTHNFSYCPLKTGDVSNH